MAELYILTNTSPTQMFGCIIKTEHRTVVIDGGTVRDREQMERMLAELSGSHVDAWFFTHPHHDHIGCFVELMKHAPQVTVDRLYYAFPTLTDESLVALARGSREAVLWQDVLTWPTRFSTRELSAADVFTFDDVTVRVLRVYNPEITENLINNSSTVYRIEGPSASVLILGDLGVEGGQELMACCSSELLRTDYTQMAHHGQNGVSRAFYEYIRPKRCIWAAPDWLWDNDVGGGFDTGRFQTVRTREWMQALGVTEHIIEKDGVHRIVL